VLGYPVTSGYVSTEMDSCLRDKLEVTWT